MSFGTDKPMAAHGLNSYRYRSPYGWIMIGASDHTDALAHAQRSLSLIYEAADMANLEIWDGSKYVSVTTVQVDV